jgi:starch synthase
LNIVLAASEVFPYAKTGGLADVAGSLPKALSRLGHFVRVVMPRYNNSRIESSGQLWGEVSVPFGNEIRKSDVYADWSRDVPVFFIDEPRFYGRGRLYGEPDDAERFAYFSRATLELIKATGDPADIIHLNDWMTGLVSVYLKIVYSADPFFSSAKTLLTIHNLAFHGLFDQSLLSRLGLPAWLHRTEEGLEFYGQASALKGGIVFSDAVSTVSPRYSKEIQTQEFGEGLDGLLRSRATDLFGIINGVDYDEWNPETDPYTVRHYSRTDLSGKTDCKLDLLRTFGLPEDPVRPLIGCISRLSEQKGIDLILESADRILDRNAVFVLLGSGADIYEKGFQELRDRRPGQVGVYLGFSDELAHKIEAGCDLYLMPSRFEPCGLNQMYSLRYGTVPVVRAVGGLDDTIQNFDRATRQGNGFKFYGYNSDQLLEKVHEALSVFSDRPVWQEMVVNCMSADCSWDRSAKQYAELYERLIRSSSAASA